MTAILKKLAVLPAVMLLASGCSTIVNAHRQKAELMSDCVQGQYPQAQEELDYKLRAPSSFNSSKVNTGDEIMWRLEAGSLNFITGRYDRSIGHFSRAEKLIEDFDERAIINLREVGAESSVLLTNPNALPYRGWCRDRIMIPVYKAFDYLGRKDEQGFQVELFRIRSTQDKILDDYQKFFEAEDKAMTRERANNRSAASGVDANAVMRDSRNGELSNALNQTRTVAHRGYANFLNPLAIFLSAYGYARTDNYQNAVVDFERLYKALPGHPLVKQYYATCLRRIGREVPSELKDIPSQDFSMGNNHVLVIFANGRSAALRQISLYIPIIFPGYATIATVAWPVCEFYPVPYRSLQVTADGKRFETLPLADMDGILAAEYTRRLPGMILRICLSTAVKEFGSYAATRATTQANGWAGLATAAGTSIYKVMFNTADTRTWEILPKEFQIIQFAMPKNRKLVLGPAGGNQYTVDLPPQCGSAVVVVHAPSHHPAAFNCQVFPLNK